MTDPLDAAIAAATASKVEQRTKVNVVIASTRRTFALDVPMDATDGEIAEFMGWCGSQLLATARDHRAKTANGRILIPT